MRKITFAVISVVLITVFLASCAVSQPVATGGNTPPPSIVSTASAASSFGKDVAYKAPIITIDPAVAGDFSTDDVKNIQDIASAYGITLSANDLKMLAGDKFVMKRLGDTTIKPKGSDDREFSGLYGSVIGGDAKSRTQANTLFWSSDVFMNSYSMLEVELLKEMENTAFAPQMSEVSKTFFEAARKKLAAATTDPEKKKWTKISEYFAVPYALFATSIAPLTNKDYSAGGDPAAMKANFETKDKAADTEISAKAFVEKLGLDKDSLAVVEQDLSKVFSADGKDVPAVFAPEYQDYATKGGVEFQVDFSQFTPRSHYTSSSLRRQYFRAMNWYIQIPFFVKSDSLTDYAFGVSQLLAEHPADLKNYDRLEATINFLVGASDDLMPVDYLNALKETKGSSDQAGAIREYLLKIKQPKIKSLGATYPSVGQVKSDDVLAATTGMRFFSGKFIIDSYWTGLLTQGDEALRPGYTQKLPPMASSLEVMGLLGSDYAKSKIPTLDFYSPQNAKAIEKAMADLGKEVAVMQETDWRKNAYTSALWTAKGLFDWEAAHRKELPRFMQGDAWPAKTLMTASGFWAELRHTVLLYAKQSMAELGGGEGTCDSRTVKDPAKAYIEPQLLTYRRLDYLAQRTQKGLEDLGFNALQNFGPLNSYITMLEEIVIPYTEKELANTKFDAETVVKKESPDADSPGKTCISYTVTKSDWETIRSTLLKNLENSLPIPVEGVVLSAKDKRAAVVADVHTGGDSSYPTRILYEGTGVPNVILVAVKDANGPRLGIGFTYAHYEFTEGYGGKRMTDEDWQTKFYKGTDDNNAFDYTKLTQWPTINTWYAQLFPKN